jgi:CrcB protein
MIKWFCLLAGSIAGGVARYMFAGAVYNRLGTSFPYGTLLVNLSGCLLIGFFNSLTEVKFLLGPNERILLMTGFCGAYTTFSTLILETSNLLRDGEAWRGCLNLGLSVVIGFLLFRLGALVGRIL